MIHPDDEAFARDFVQAWRIPASAMAAICDALSRARAAREDVSALHVKGCPSVAAGIAVGNCCENNDRALQAARSQRRDA